MKKGMRLWVLCIAVFAAVMVSSASLFATQVLPIAERDPALVGPINDSTGAGNVVTNVPAPVPEPTTWGMLILGGGLLTAARRFRRKQM